MRQWRNGLHLKLQLLWSSKNSLDKKANYLTNWQKLKALHPTSTHPTLAYAGGSRSDEALRIFRQQRSNVARSGVNGMQLIQRTFSASWFVSEKRPWNWRAPSGANAWWKPLFFPKTTLSEPLLSA
jgi:hypothetical protein